MRSVWRYDKMMGAFDGKGFMTEDPKDLRGTLDEALNFPGPVLVIAGLREEATTVRLARPGGEHVAQRGHAIPGAAPVLRVRSRAECALD